MPKIIVDLPVEAGVYTEQTARGAVSRWKDADKVRWRYGLPEKIGGWTQVAVGPFKGLVRKIWDWTTLDKRNISALGTESKLYLYDTDVLYDVTPIRRTIQLNNPFDTTIGSATVVVNDSVHGAYIGDYVRFSNAVAVGGITIDGEYQIVTIIDTDSYEIVHTSAASSSVTGGGGLVNLEYDISVGKTLSTFGLGWSTGAWSQGTWGTPRIQSNVTQPLRTWSLDNWGEDLIANPRGGSIYWWDRGTGQTSRAVLLEQAPERANFIIISQRDRHLFALGCTDYFTGQFDPLLIRWCSKEDFNDWIPTSFNTSGDLRLYRGSEIIGSIRTRGEILVFTDVSVHQVNYLGGQSVYGVQVAGENVSLLGPNAAIEVDYRVFFMAEADFYQYDGVLRPIPCDVRNYVYENLTTSQKDKVFAGINREFNEIWWFYPAKDAAVYIETNLAESLPSFSYEQQSDIASVYEVSINAAGYAWLSTSPNNSNADSVWMFTDSSAAKVKDPDDIDYEATFTLNGTANMDYGIIFEVTDLDGTSGLADDNVDGLWAYVNPSTNVLTVGKNVAGVSSILTNASASYSLSGLATPVTLASGSKYGIRVHRSLDTITVYLWDEDQDIGQQVASVALSAGEITSFPGTISKSGFNFQKNNTATDDDQARLNSYRVGEGGAITSSDLWGPSTEVSRYVIYNYEENTWSIGSMVRTAWADRSPVFEKPYAAGEDMYLYIHETGVDENGQSMFAFCETYDAEIPEAGENLMHLDQLIPDFIDLDGAANIELKGKKYPQQAEYQEKGPYPVTTGVNKISTRIRGRQIALRISSNAVGDYWRMGTMRARIGPHGKRA